jgi:hypothetical protein
MQSLCRYKRNTAEKQATRAYVWAEIGKGDGQGRYPLLLNLVADETCPGAKRRVDEDVNCLNKRCDWFMLHVANRSGLMIGISETCPGAARAKGVAVSFDRINGCVTIGRHCMWPIRRVLCSNTAPDPRAIAAITCTSKKRTVSAGRR